MAKKIRKKINLPTIQVVLEIIVAICGIIGFLIVWITGTNTTSSVSVTVNGTIEGERTPITNLRAADGSLEYLVLPTFLLQNLINPQPVPSANDKSVIADLENKVTQLNQELTKYHWNDPQAELHREKCSTAFDKGDFNLAEQCFREVIRQNEAAIAEQEELTNKGRTRTVSALVECSFAALRLDTREGYERAATYLAKAEELSQQINSKRDSSLLQGQLLAYMVLGGCYGDIDAYRKTMTLAPILLATVNNIDSPQLWANAQIALGRAQVAVGEMENKPEYIEEAIKTYKKAFQVIHKNTSPTEWANLRYYQGQAYDVLANTHDQEQQLERAKIAYEDYLQVFSSEQEPARWAHAQISLGRVLRALAQIKKDEVLYKRSIVAFQNSLQGYTVDHDPHMWSLVNYYIGITLDSIGRNENNYELMKQAVSAYKNALLYLSQEDEGDILAYTQYALGSAMFDIDSMREDGDADFFIDSTISHSLQSSYETMGRITRVELAINAYQEALSWYNRERGTCYWINAQFKLGESFRALWRYYDKEEYLEKARNIYEEVLQGWSHGQYPEMLSNIHATLGMTLRSLGLRKNDLNILEQAAEALRKSVQRSIFVEYPLIWAGRQYYLGNTLMTLGMRKGDIELLQKSLATIKEAREVFVVEHNLREQGLADRDIRRIEKFLASKNTSL